MRHLPPSPFLQQEEDKQDSTVRSHVSGLAASADVRLDESALSHKHPAPESG